MMAGVIVSLGLPDPHWGLPALGVLPVGCYWRQRVVACASLGLVLASVSGVMWLDTRLPAACLGEPVRIIGRIDALPRTTPAEWGGWRVTAALRVSAISDNRCEGPRRILLSQHLDAEDLNQALQYGARVSGEIKLKPLSSQWNPGVLPDQGRWASRGIDVAAIVIGPLVQTHQGGSLGEFRRTLLDAWSRQEAQGWVVLRALLLGDTRGITSSLWADLRRLGIVHLVVISGLHIALLAGLTAQLLALPRRLGRIPRDRGSDQLTTLATLVIAGLYVLLIGAPLPAQRAYLMLAAAKVPQLCGWSSETRHSLLLAMTGMLLWEPKIALGASFWLSAGATWILVTDSSDSKFPWTLMRLQFKVVLLMAPMTLFWFGEASWLGVVANIVMLPAVTIIMVPAGFAGALLSGPWPTLSQFFLTLSAQTWDLLMPIASAWLLSCGACDVISHPLSLIGFVLVLVSVFCWSHHRRAAVLAYLLTITVALRSPPPASEPLVTVLDVGQGLAVVIESGGKTLVYDTGDGYPDGFSQAEKTLAPYLRSRGIEVIDVLMVSHADRDHSGGLSFLRDQMPIHRHLGFAGEPCRNGERWRWHALEILIVNGSGQGEVETNDQSCGFLMSFNGYRLLALGDISTTQEREMVRYWRKTLASEVLLLAHHGSRTSTSHALLKWVDPAWALISAGRENRFGHPHAAVLQRLGQRRGLHALNTAEVGAIQIRFTEKGRPRVSRQRHDGSPYWLKLP